MLYTHADVCLSVSCSTHNNDLLFFNYYYVYADEVISKE